VQVKTNRCRSSLPYRISGGKTESSRADNQKNFNEDASRRIGRRIQQSATLSKAGMAEPPSRPCYDSVTASSLPRAKISKNQEGGQTL